MSKLCCCGSNVRTGCESFHLGTKKHTTYMNRLNEGPKFFLCKCGSYVAYNNDNKHSSTKKHCKFAELYKDAEITDLEKKIAESWRNKEIIYGPLNEDMYELFELGYRNMKDCDDPRGEYIYELYCYINAYICL